MSEASRMANKLYRQSPTGRAALRRYYQSEAGRASSRRNSGRNRQKLRALVDTIKSRPCADCGGTFDPVCMDFDHRPGETKTGNVSRMVSEGSIKMILAEAAKCDVVCANCHRLRSYRSRDHRVASGFASDSSTEPEPSQIELPLQTLGGVS